eukprot:g9093.t1
MDVEGAAVADVGQQGSGEAAQEEDEDTTTDPVESDEVEDGTHPRGRFAFEMSIAEQEGRPFSLSPAHDQEHHQATVVETGPHAAPAARSTSSAGESVDQIERHIQQHEAFMASLTPEERDRVDQYILALKQELLARQSEPEMHSDADMLFSTSSQMEVVDHAVEKMLNRYGYGGPSTFYDEDLDTHGLHGEQGASLEKSESSSAALLICQEIVKLLITPSNQWEDPISLEVMGDPCLASDGHIYERSSIQRWLQQSNVSPKTREPMAPATHPVRLLRNSISDWRSQQEKAFALALTSENQGELCEAFLAAGFDVNRFFVEQAGLGNLDGEEGDQGDNKKVPYLKSGLDLPQETLQISIGPPIHAAEARKYGRGSVCCGDGEQTVPAQIPERFAPFNVEWGSLTALHNAVLHDKKDVVNLLLDLDGIDPWATDEWGNTPLHLAAFVGNVEVVENLLLKGRVIKRPKLPPPPAPPASPTGSTIEAGAGGTEWAGMTEGATSSGAVLQGRALSLPILGRADSRSQVDELCSRFSRRSWLERVDLEFQQQGRDDDHLILQELLELRRELTARLAEVRVEDSRVAGLDLARLERTIEGSSSASASSEDAGVGGNPNPGSLDRSEYQSPLPPGFYSDESAGEVLSVAATSERLRQLSLTTPTDHDELSPPRAARTASLSSASDQVVRSGAGTGGHTRSSAANSRSQRGSASAAHFSTSNTGGPPGTIRRGSNQIPLPTSQIGGGGAGSASPALARTMNMSNQILSAGPVGGSGGSGRSGTSRSSASPDHPLSGGGDPPYPGDSISRFAPLPFPFPAGDYDSPAEQERITAANRAGQRYYNYLTGEERSAATEIDRAPELSSFRTTQYVDPDTPFLRARSALADLQRINRNVRYRTLVENARSMVREEDQDPNAVDTTVGEMADNVNLANSKGYTPLHVAVMAQHTNVVALLLKARARVRLETDTSAWPGTGWTTTPLGSAVVQLQSKNVDILRLLWLFGARSLHHIATVGHRRFLVEQMTRSLLHVLMGHENKMKAPRKRGHYSVGAA